jgi:hypothetical protein
MTCWVTTTHYASSYTYCTSGWRPVNVGGTCHRVTENKRTLRSVLTEAPKTSWSVLESVAVLLDEAVNAAAFEQMADLSRGSGREIGAEVTGERVISPAKPSAESVARPCWVPWTGVQYHMHIKSDDLLVRLAFRFSLFCHRRRDDYNSTILEV